MSRYISYSPEQAWLVPPSVEDELGPDHLIFFLHALVERLDLSRFEVEHQEAGRPSYPPQLLLKVWLYAYSQGLTSSRRLEQRLREDLGFRFLAGNLQPDHWTLNQFRKRHPRALNDVFTQVVEAARQLGMGRLGRVAIDSTRVAANASPYRRENLETLRRERARLRQRIRRWQKQCDREDPETAGTAVESWRERLEEIPRHLELLRKSGQAWGSRTDPESRNLRQRGGFCLGYTAEIAVSEDHLIVAQRVHQAAIDNHSLAAMTEAATQECRERPESVVADCGYYSMDQIQKVAAEGIQVYVPDVVAARELAGAIPAQTMNLRQQGRHPGLQSLADAVPGGASLLRPAQGHGRAGVWGLKTATRNASISAARFASGGNRVDAGHHRLQSDPNVRDPGFEEDLNPASAESPLPIPQLKPTVLRCFSTASLSGATTRLHFSHRLRKGGEQDGGLRKSRKWSSQAGI
jgi:transposase